ncbi:MAG: indolepyruvate ferredoxin oxidoreductase subunit alpha [Gammaproteobacteria bacterium]|nr:indolepyruvate ferredoxin oxidoreductase subunit alpha [Gammaproteobacteria bacterium]
MAERSFAKEVQDLRIGAGETFRGEGILAVTKALLQSGVAYVGGYQGAPISHLMDVLGDAQQQGILDEWGVHFESSASEAAAAAMLAASVNYPLRGAVTWKSPVGTNVASDALANLASGGVTGGALIVVGEDYGEGSSIMQERTHAFAMKSQLWLLDPRPDLESIVAAVEHGFALSEASRTPVMLELRIRACHVYGEFTARDNRRPSPTLAEALERPVRDTTRITLPPVAFRHEQEKIASRWPDAVAYIREHGLNEHFPGEGGDVGLVLQGGLYNSVIRALQMIGLADLYGRTPLPLYVMNVTYPLVDDELVAFCRDKRAVLMIEEGQPDFLEQALNAILRKAGVATRVEGKGPLPAAGEYTPLVLEEGLARFLEAHAGGDLKPGPAGRDRLHPVAVEQGARLEGVVPARPAGFCTGCPERPLFGAIKLLQQEFGEFHVSCDIGCHLFSILPPFHIGNTTMGYGLGAAGSAAFNVPGGQRKVLSIMGDGGFWHNGLTSGIGNAVFNRSDNVVVIVDNRYSAATGGQDVLSSNVDNPERSTSNPIENAVRGVGVSWVRTVPWTYDVGQLRDVLRDALTSEERGPKVVIAQSECMLNRQRRERPRFRARVREGRRAVRQRFGVDAETCTGDHACMRLSGCPSLTLADNPDPLRDQPVTRVVDSCVGCGYCGEVAHAAVLCPSFYRADVVHNPGLLERLVDRVRRRAVAWLAGREAA